MTEIINNLWGIGLVVSLILFGLFVYSTRNLNKRKREYLYWVWMYFGVIIQSIILLYYLII